MWIKNGRIILNENNLELEIERLEKELKNFFEYDSRFCMNNIDVFVELDDDCWNENTHHFWNELSIHVINYDKEVELGGEFAGEKRSAFVCITYTTESFEPNLVINNGLPEFYYVFNGTSWTITNSDTWENNRDEITVEDIIEKEALSKFEVD